MGFSFTSPSSAPAPGATAGSSGGGFSFGGAPAPVPANNAFGSSAPAPAAAGGGFSFGGSNTTNTSTTSTSTSLAPSGGLFGSAPASGGLFGSNNNSTANIAGAPAPSLFGSPAQASTAFGAPTTNNTPQQQSEVQPLSRRTKYSELPPHYKKAVDDVHAAIMQHRKIMINLQSTGPQKLVDQSLTKELQTLSNHSARMDQQLTYLQQELDGVWQQSRQMLTHAVVAGKYPLEYHASRRGYRLTEEKKDDSAGVMTQSSDQRMQQLLQQQSAHYLDRIEHMPSPYLVDTLARLERATRQAHQKYLALQASRLPTLNDGTLHVQHVVERHHVHLHNVHQQLTRIRQTLQQLRIRYHMVESEHDVLQEMEKQQQDYERTITSRVQAAFLKAAPPQQGVPAPAPGGLFGAPAPAPSSGLFGGKAPAPAGGGLFGAPAPAPAGGGLFGSTPAPAFGAAPAPSFGSFGAPAPAPANVHSQKKKAGSRSSSRLRR